MASVGLNSELESAISTLLARIERVDDYSADAISRFADAVRALAAASSDLNSSTWGSYSTWTNTANIDDAQP